MVRARHSPDLLDLLAGWRAAFEQLIAAPNGVAALGALIEYTLRVGEVSADEFRDFIRQLGPAADEAFMTGAQQLIEQGRAAGKVEVVLRLLAAKFGPLEEAVISRVHAADPGELDRYVEQLLYADTLADVFD